MGANTTLQLQGRANLLGSPDLNDYPLARVRWEGEFSSGHRALISAEKADHIAITGSGSIFGPPLTLSRLRNPRGPCLIEVSECNDVHLEGFTTQYQQLWAIHLSLSERIVARNLTIRSVNFNGDGIDADSCRDLLIERCNIDTGDDAIALKSGRGMEAVRLARPIEDVTIRDCTLVSSIYAGLAIGTEISGGARRIRIENCTISGRQNAIFIKSRDGRGASMEDITGENLTIQNSPTFIGIDLTTKGIQAAEPVTGEIEKWTLLKNVTFNNIKVHNVAELIAGQHIPAERPADGLTLTHISGDCEKGITLANVINAKFAEINLTGFKGPPFTMTNVKGTGFENGKAGKGESTTRAK
jgi:polygalacturonase